MRESNANQAEQLVYVEKGGEEGASVQVRPSASIGRCGTPKSEANNSILFPTRNLRLHGLNVSPAVLGENATRISLAVYLSGRDCPRTRVEIWNTISERGRTVSGQFCQSARQNGNCHVSAELAEPNGEISGLMYFLHFQVNEESL
jgi:hypothetical protein